MKMLLLKPVFSEVVESVVLPEMFVGFRVAPVLGLPKGVCAASCSDCKSKSSREPAADAAGLRFGRLLLLLILLS